MPMQYKYYFETIHRILKNICRSNTLFGKIPIILGGDFAQILPIVRKANRARTIAANLQQSFL